MFRSRRSTLIKRLWKCKVGHHEGDSASKGGVADDTQSVAVAAAAAEIKAATNSLLKRLKEEELEGLVQAVESKGGDKTAACVLLPNGPVQMGKRNVLQPHVLCCQIWRWPLLNPDTLKRLLPVCSSADNPSSICCNPYHWSLCIMPDNLPPLYEKAYSERVFNKDDDESICTVESLETGNTPTALRNSDVSSNGTWQPYWCHVAYWELRERVGRLLPVTQPSVNIFQHLPHGDGMCLSLLQKTNNANVLRTREKIGFGITLSREGDGVWIYNRSENAVFAHSPTLELPNARTVVVKKIPPGYAVKIFDFELSEVFETLRDPKLSDGPFDPNAVQISFGKGWGPCYSRQFVTSCPCWLEVLFRR